MRDLTCAAMVKARFHPLANVVYYLSHDCKTGMYNEVGRPFHHCAGQKCVKWPEGQCTQASCTPCKFNRKTHHNASQGVKKCGKLSYHTLFSSRKHFQPRGFNKCPSHSSLKPEKSILTILPCLAPEHFCKSCYFPLVQCWRRRGPSNPVKVDRHRDPERAHPQILQRAMNND